MPKKVVKMVKLQVPAGKATWPSWCKHHGFC